MIASQEASRLFIEADALAEARIADRGRGVNIGSQARVTEYVLKGVLGFLPKEWEVVIGGGPHLPYDEEELRGMEGRRIRKVGVWRPQLLPFGNKYTVLPVRKFLERHFYPRLIASSKPHVVLYTQRFPAGQYQKGRRELWTALDLYPFYKPDASQQEQISRLRERMSRTEVIAISQTTADDVHRILGIPRSRIHKAYLGVNREIFTHIGQENDAKILADLNLPPQFIFYSGAVFSRKNVLNLVKAIGILNAGGRAEKIPLVVAGGMGWADLKEKTEFREVTEALSADQLYRHLGRVPDHYFAAIHRAATCYMHPSTFEGFGITILEAMSCGAPVVCGRNSAVQEVAGEAAIYAEDVCSPESIALSLRKVLDFTPLQREEMIGKSISQAARFSIQSFERKVAEVILNGPEA